MRIRRVVALLLLLSFIPTPLFGVIESPPECVAVLGGSTSYLRAIRHLLPQPSGTTLLWNGRAPQVKIVVFETSQFDLDRFAGDLRRGPHRPLSAKEFLMRQYELRTRGFDLAREGLLPSRVTDANPFPGSFATPEMIVADVIQDQYRLLQQLMCHSHFCDEGPVAVAVTSKPVRTIVDHLAPRELLYATGLVDLSFDHAFLEEVTARPPTPAEALERSRFLVVVTGPADARETRELLTYKDRLRQTDAAMKLGRAPAPAKRLALSGDDQELLRQVMFALGVAADLKTFAFVPPPLWLWNALRIIKRRALNKVIEVVLAEVYNEFIDDRDRPPQGR